MEGLNPALKLVWEVKKSVEKGESVRGGIKTYIQLCRDPWKSTVCHWYSKLEQGEPTQDLVSSQKSIYRRQILLILERGLKGEAILGILGQIEKETLEKVENDIEEFSARAPYLLLAPLCLFLFPACLILMLGPFLIQLMQAF